MKSTVEVCIFLAILTSGTIAQGREGSSSELWDLRSVSLDEGPETLKGELIEGEVPPLPDEEIDDDPRGVEVVKLFVHVSFTRTDDRRVARTKVRVAADGWDGKSDPPKVFGAELLRYFLEGYKEAVRTGDTRNSEGFLDLLSDRVLWEQRVEWVRKQIHAHHRKYPNKKKLYFVSGHNRWRAAISGEAPGASLDGSLDELCGAPKAVFGSVVVAKDGLTWKGVASLLKFERPHHVSFMAPGSSDLEKRTGSERSDLAIALRAPYETRGEEYTLLSGDLPDPRTPDYASTVFFVVNGVVLDWWKKRHRHPTTASVFLQDWLEKLPGLRTRPRVDDPYLPLEFLGSLEQTH